MKLAKVLSLLVLVLVLAHLSVVQVLGTLPNQMKSVRMTGSTLASTIPTQVGNLETAMTDILGVPIDTDVVRAGFVWSSAGLQRVKFWAISDPASPVSGDEWLSNTTANTLKYYDGATTRSLLDLSLTQGPITNKQFTTIELGDPSDTTLSRVSAGVVAVEGTNIAMQGGSKNESGTYTADLGPAGTGARVISTIYQNTSGKKRRVSAVVLGADTQRMGVEVLMDTFTPPTTIRAISQIRIVSAAGEKHELSVWFEVPNNYYYEVANTVGGETLVFWYELDE